MNKNSLETGRLVGIQSLSSVVTDLITNSTKHELLVMKGNPTSSTIINKHSTVNRSPTLTSDSDSVTLDISFSNDLPKEYTSMSLTFTSHPPGTSRFFSTASAVGLDTRPPRGIPTGTTTTRVMRSKITFLVGTFIENMVTSFTSRGSSDT